MLSLRGISRTADDEAIFFVWIIKIASSAVQRTRNDKWILDKVVLFKSFDINTANHFNNIIFLMRSESPDFKR